MAKKYVKLTKEYRLIVEAATAKDLEKWGIDEAKEATRNLAPVASYLEVDNKDGIDVETSQYPKVRIPADYDLVSVFYKDKQILIDYKLGDMKDAINTVKMYAIHPAEHPEYSNDDTLIFVVKCRPNTPEEHIDMYTTTVGQIRNYAINEAWHTILPPVLDVNAIIENTKNEMLLDFVKK